MNEMTEIAMDGFLNAYVYVSCISALRILKVSCFSY
jgi:hypothetical protein